jgi:hypothetical protein
VISLDNNTFLFHYDIAWIIRDLESLPRVKSTSHLQVQNWPEAELWCCMRKKKVEDTAQDQRLRNLNVADTVIGTDRVYGVHVFAFEPVP